MKTRFDDFDTQVQCDELTPTCPFCDEQLDGDTIDGMHANCNRQFGIELQEAFPDPDDLLFLPIGNPEVLEFDMPTEDDIDWMIRRSYGY